MFNLRPSRTRNPVTPPFRHWNSGQDRLNFLCKIECDDDRYTTVFQWVADRTAHVLLRFWSNAHSHFIITALFCQYWLRKYAKLERGMKRDGEQGPRSWGENHWNIS
jgi:hypothetical protein